jgi:hypothetical protein
MPLVHDSWMRLKPNEIEGSKESFDDYYPRILEKHDFSHIPKEVFEQWIHAHHDNPYTLRNYGWFDYEKVKFELVKWEASALIDIYVIESFREYVTSRAELKNLSKFMCKKEDLLTWKENGTWRTPPIIIDVRTLKTTIPRWSELQPPFQLVEGHSRYGYFKSMLEQEKGEKRLAAYHSIYLMRVN